MANLDQGIPPHTSPLQDAVNRVFHLNDELDPLALNLVEGACKIYFDLIRNLVIIAALRYVADKTGSVLIDIGYYVSIGVFMLRIDMALTKWQIRLFKSHSLNVVVWILSNFIILIGGFFLIGLSVSALVAGH